MSVRVQGIGLIGAGVIFDAHAIAWAQLTSRARCFAVAEIDDRRRYEATRKHFLPVDVADYHDLLSRDDVEIVGICTPPFLHEEMVCAALEAGKYVLCEKPLAPTLAQADRIIDVAEQYPGKLSTIFQLRFSDEMQRLRWLLRQGYLGKLKGGSAFRRTRPQGWSATRGQTWGRWSVAGGGMVMTQFIHHLDQLLQIFGSVAQVEATMSTESFPIESEDTFSARITFESGAVVSCEGTMNTPPSGWGIEVLGEDLKARLPWGIEAAPDRLRQINSEMSQAFPGAMQKRNLPNFLNRLGDGQRTRPVNSHQPYFEAVLDAIEAGRPLPICAEDARKTVELCAAIYTSAISGEPVELPLTSSTPFYEGISVDDYRNACATIS